MRIERLPQASFSRSWTTSSRSAQPSLQFSPGGYYRYERDSNSLYKPLTVLVVTFLFWGFRVKRRGNAVTAGTSLFRRGIDLGFCFVRGWESEGFDVQGRGRGLRALAFRLFLGWVCRKVYSLFVCGIDGLWNFNNRFKFHYSLSIGTHIGLCIYSSRSIIRIPSKHILHRIHHTKFIKKNSKIR